MPLLWSEVTETLDPRAFTVRAAPDRIARAKPWADYAEGARPLAAAIKKLGRAKAAA